MADLKYWARKSEDGKSVLDFVDGSNIDRLFSDIEETGGWRTGLPQAERQECLWHMRVSKAVAGNTEEHAKSDMLRSLAGLLRKSSRRPVWTTSRGKFSHWPGCRTRRRDEPGLEAMVGLDPGNVNSGSLTTARRVRSAPDCSSSDLAEILPQEASASRAASPSTTRASARARGGDH